MTGHAPAGAVKKRVRPSRRPFKASPGCGVVRALGMSAAWLVCCAATAGAQKADPARDASGAPRWAVDSATVTFEIRNAGFPVHGSFSGFQADVRFDAEHLEQSRIIASIDPATVETGIGIRDRHLRRHGYFDVERFGRVEMTSVRLRRPDGDTFGGTFRLRIRDVEREVDIPFTFEAAGSSARMSGSLTLDRLDWGIGEESVILSNDVTVQVQLWLARR
jgi:polyisoprenoid-binding protein YceI